MQPTQFIWKNGRIIPWHEATVHVLAHGLHYGSAIFEGIRFYNVMGCPTIFKLSEHIQRLFYSASHLAMKIPYTEKEINEAIINIIRVNKINEGYIRPLAYYGYGSMKVVPNEDLPVEVIVACWPWGDYLPVKSVDVKTSSFIRIHPKSTIADAKISGHYINSILAGLAIKNTHYHEALLLDAEGYVAEGSAENIFIVKNGQLITPPVGTILEGITRNTVIEIANYYHIPVEQHQFTKQEIMQADEAFFSGTAVEITAVRSLDDCIIASGETGPITKKIQAAYKKITYGQLLHFKKCLTGVRQKEEAAA